MRHREQHEQDAFTDPDLDVDVVRAGSPSSWITCENGVKCQKNGRLSRDRPDVVRVVVDVLADGQLAVAGESGNVMIWLTGAPSSPGRPGR